MNSPLPLTVATATTPLPTFGSVSIVAGGRYSGSTRSAAYSVPRCVVLVKVESASKAVNGFTVRGWIHHTPLLAKSTICWPSPAPVTRPLIGATRSDPPAPASGTVVNSMDGAPPPGARHAPAAAARRTRDTAHVLEPTRRAAMP